jgi:hypothetical protein
MVSICSWAKVKLIGNHQAVYLMVWCRLFVKLQHILNCIVQQLDCIYIPAPEIRAQFTTTASTTQVLSNVLTTTAQTSFAHPLNALTTVVPPPTEQFMDADSDTSISYSPQSPPQYRPPVQPECISLPREFTHVQTQTDYQFNQVSYIADSPWAWLND